MFDIGFLEMLTIGVVALVVIGPERLPEVATKVGRYVGKAQRFVRGVRSDISRELESGDLKKLIGDQKSQIDELRQMVHTATKDLESSTSTAMRDAEKSFSDMGTDVKDSLADSSKDTASQTSSSADLTDDEEEFDNEFEQLDAPAKDISNDDQANKNAS